jgi:N-acyl-D-amino-acid deacylase
MPYDTIIRNGLVVDGISSAGYRADVGILGGIIVAIGSLPERGREEIDANGCIVTPGFVDIHTHYDGQAIWSEFLTPSSRHGVTTVVTGNCGVGFAPCRQRDHDLLVDAMEGVEDIPEIVMTTGLSWEWETFSDYLNALAGRRHDIDIACYLPHSPLRVYAMGARGVDREAATRDDIDRMASLLAEAMDAGALGFSTSRTQLHRRGDGDYLPSFLAAEAELQGIISGMDGRGIVQVVTSYNDAKTDEDRHDEISLLARISREGRVPVTFSCTQQNTNPTAFDEALRWVDSVNGDPDVSIRPQFAPRPIGVYVGHDLSSNPFTAHPTYRRLVQRPRAELIAELSRPDIKERITKESPDTDVAPLVLAIRQFSRLYSIINPPNYEPTDDQSIGVRAATLGMSAEELAYDLLLADDGHAMLYVALANYGYGNLDHLAQMFSRSDSVIGLGDGGAHYGMICDASYPTFVLTHWVRERSAQRVGLCDAVRVLAADPADLVGLGDRGRIAVGRKADINVIDHAALRLNYPEVVHDLPGNGKRIQQTAKGYRYTMVSGQIILRDDRPTGKLPGELVRGTR